MRIRFWFALAIVISMLASAAIGQPKKTTQSQKVIAVTAEALGKEFVKDGPKAEKKYSGKSLRVTGAVDSAIDEIVYLRTGARSPQGQEVNIVLRFKPGDIPKVKPGQKITIEGSFDREAVLGPSLKDCRAPERKK